MTMVLVVCLIYAFFLPLKESSLWNLNLFEFIRYHLVFRKNIENKFQFFNSACIFLDVFWQKNLPEYMNSCKTTHNEDKLVIFFLQ